MKNAKIMNNGSKIWGLLFALALISGCATISIEDMKNSDLVGEKVTISGTVQNTIKIGTLSGYTIKDETDTIRVASETLPAEGSKIQITGIVMKDTIFGYYIKAE